MELASGIASLLVRLPLWALFASPLIALLVYVAHWLRQRPPRSQIVRVLFALIAGVLLAPMPVGMFMALVPNSYLAFGDPSYYALTWPYAAVSIPLSVLLVLWAVWRYLAPSASGPAI